MQNQETKLEMVNRWIDEGKLNTDRPRTEAEAQKIINNLLTT